MSTKFTSYAVQPQHDFQSMVYAVQNKLQLTHVAYIPIQVKKEQLNYVTKFCKAMSL